MCEGYVCVCVCARARAMSGGRRVVGLSSKQVEQTGGSTRVKVQGETGLGETGSGETDLG